MEYWNSLIGLAQTVILYLQYRDSKREPVVKRAQANNQLGFGRKYGLLLAMALLVVLAWAPTLFSRLSGPQRVTSENIEDVMNKWARDLGLGIQKLPPEPQYIFHYVLTAPHTGYGGEKGNLPPIRVVVLRRRDTEKFLIIQTGQQPTNLDSLTSLQRGELASLIAVELARTNAEFEVEMTKGSIPRIITSRVLPITSALTDYEFYSAMKTASSAAMLVGSTVSLYNAGLKRQEESAVPSGTNAKR